MVAYLRVTINEIGQHARKIVVEHCDTKRKQKYSLSDLGLRTESMTEATAQFWSCAQGRILMVQNNVARTKAEPVPEYLLPNAVIKGRIWALFARAAV